MISPSTNVISTSSTSRGYYALRMDRHQTVMSSPVRTSTILFKGNMRSFVRLWRRLPFTVRFAAILAFTGVLIAVTAGSLATGDARTAAGHQASYGMSVAEALISDQAASTQRFAQTVRHP